MPCSSVVLASTVAPLGVVALTVTPGSNAAPDGSVTVPETGLSRPSLLAPAAVRSKHDEGTHGAR